MTATDVLVLGGGSGGYSCALRAAQLGMRVVLVEADELGGTCLHHGCIPTKALLHAGEVADSIRRADQFGLVAELERVDGAALRSYQDRVIGKLHSGLKSLLEGRGVEVVIRYGRVVAPRTVEVDGRRLVGRHLVVATGSHTRTIPGVELDGVRILGSEHALRLDRVPTSAVVLGGGVIGCEMASAWRSLGAEITVVEALPRLVRAEEPAASRVLERAFRKRGIEVRTASPVEKVETTEHGVRVYAGDEEPLTAEVLLVAVGRGPSTADIGLEPADVEIDDRGFVRSTNVCAPPHRRPMRWGMSSTARSWRTAVLPTASSSLRRSRDFPRSLSTTSSSHA
jgi:dihydrolipoamide dehydrogenase